MKKFRFGIVGCGRIAQRHAMHIAAKAELVAVCDNVEQKADELAQKYQARPFYELDDFLQNTDADAITICTPNGLHADHTVKALQAGFHVLCEKPMAISTPDCQKMISAAESNGRRLFIVKQNRFNPPVTAVKEAIDAGKLGRIYSLQLNCFWNRDTSYYADSLWKGTKKLDGGILYTQFSHFIDLLHWLAGDLEPVKALMANFSHANTIEMEDSGVVLLEFASGALGCINYSVNSYRKNMEGSLTILAEKGSVKIGGQYLNELEYQDIRDYRISNLPEGNKANNYGTYEGSMSNHDKVYDNVIDVLQNNVAMTASAYDGLKTVEIIEKIYNTANR